MTQTLLGVRGVSVRFGGITALDDVSFDIERGQLAALIGPNGAGKTTLFDCICRMRECDSGGIDFDGRALLEMPVQAIAAAGIGRTFQSVSLFGSMSVLENVMMGGHSRANSGFLAQALRLARAAKEEESAAERARALLTALGLQALARKRVAELPFALQKRVELARALAIEPKLLLLDEPASGLSGAEVAELGALLQQLRDRYGTTVLLVEHNLELVMRISTKVIVLDFGRKIAAGPPQEVRRHPEVVQAYLGGGR